MKWLHLTKMAEKPRHDMKHILHWNTFCASVVSSHTGPVDTGLKCSFIVSLTKVKINSRVAAVVSAINAGVTSPWCAFHQDGWNSPSKRCGCYTAIFKAGNYISSLNEPILRNIMHHMHCKALYWPTKLLYVCPIQRLVFILCGAVIMRSNYSHILAIDTPELARVGEILGVCCEIKIWFWFIFCHCRRVVVYNIVLHWTAVQRHSTPFLHM